MSSRFVASSMEVLRKKRRRSGVCRGVAAGVEVPWSTEKEEVRLGPEALPSSSGGQEMVEGEVSLLPQRPGGAVFLMEAEPLLTEESERCLWVESRVLSAASIFLLNTLLVSWHLDQAKLH